MTSSALNKANSSQEIFFEVELPKTAFITNFSMEIDKEIYVGEVKEKQQAKKQYEKAVLSGKTAGLVKASGRKMEKFSVSVNIAANSSVTFILTYEELLQRKLGQYTILTRVTPKQLVQNFQIEANIYEPQGIVFVDAHGTFLSNELLPLVKKTVTHTKAQISFSPMLDQQRKCLGCDTTLIDGDFIIKYDVNRAKSLGDIQIVNGYFVHFFAPPDLPPVPKNVVFIIDKSGSMAGTKISQTQEAMLAILQDLHEADYFALIQFSGYTMTWKDSLTKASKGNVAKAMKYVKRIHANGATNLNAAVLRAVKMLVTDRKDNKLPTRSVDMIILLTDGMPNEGVTHLLKIQENVRRAVSGKMSLFCLGFGKDVDYSFLDVMAKQNKGLARRIYEASDATLQLQGFYKEVASPLLTEVDLRYPDNTVGFLTTNHFSELFNGSEIVVAGRVTENDIDNFLVEVFGNGPEEDFQVRGQTSAVDWGVIYPEQEYIFGNFTERLWAYLTIQQLLEKSETGTEQEKSNATAKALAMSLQYNFVTPLTSMVVTKPETEEGPGSPLIADKLTEGRRGQRGENPIFRNLCVRPLAHHYTFFLDGDPHFVIELPEREDALCFNIDDTPGTIFNLVRDPNLGILVNGQTVGKKKVVPDGKVSTYFGRFGIVHQTLGVRLQVTTQDISVSQDGESMRLMWSDIASHKGPKMDLALTKNCSLTVTLKGSFKFKFMLVLHTKVWKNQHYQQDYLGFYTLDSHLMSPAVHGLLGQFYHGVDFEVGNLRSGEGPETLDATMFVKGRELSVTRHWQRDFRRDVKNGEKVPCWFIYSNGTGLIDGSASDYIVSGLFKAI
ncbi:inter-alpha-trypsin inhibitor heavy chain H3-like [Lampris incognitus]|uniref:inter-alpha-trypsin inhibitor heavy chain H3-like n=1 Tax=Lampris incognitus TaxID=2546036 RepID=UPI0024B5A4D8|nr:inter-alpha-trypsin inhibitor heavy chain H3-like [Lampris incognitus]